MSRFVVSVFTLLVSFGCWEGDPCKNDPETRVCSGISYCVPVDDPCPNPSDMMMEEDAAVDAGINDDMSMPSEPENGSDLSCDDQFVASVSGSFTNNSGNINFFARVNPDGLGALIYNTGPASDNLDIKVRVADANGYPTNIGDPNRNGVFDIQLGYTNDGYVKTATVFVYNGWAAVSSRPDHILMTAENVDKNQGEIDAYPGLGDAVNFKTTNTDNGKGYTIEMQDQNGNAGWLKFTYRCTGYN